MYVVQCHTIGEMAIFCAQFTKEGLVFHADTNTMKIELSGGY